MRRIFILLIMFASCSASDKLAGNCEQRLDSSISSSWRYDSSSNAIKADKSFLRDLDSGKFNCLLGHDTNYIIKKFGTGYEITYDVSPKAMNVDHLKSAVSYILYPRCSLKKTCDWVEMQFNFDSTGVLRKYGTLRKSVTVIQ